MTDLQQVFFFFFSFLFWSLLPWCALLRTHTLTLTHTHTRTPTPTPIPPHTHWHKLIVKFIVPIAGEFSHGRQPQAAKVMAEVRPPPPPPPPCTHTVTHTLNQRNASSSSSSWGNLNFGFVKKQNWVHSEDTRCCSTVPSLKHMLLHPRNSEVISINIWQPDHAPPPPPPPPPFLSSRRLSYFKHNV